MVDQKFRIYTQAANEATKTAAEFGKTVWWMTDDGAALFARVNKLPIDVSGIKPSAAQLAKWKSTLADFGNAATIMVDNANTLVQVAETTHDVAQKLSTVAGGASIFLTGA